MRYHPESLLDIPWEITSTMLSGRAAKDIPRLDLRSIEEAGRFLHAYGFKDPATGGMEGTEALRQEALTFLEKEILQDESELKIDPDVMQEQDLRTILLWASSPRWSARRQWACALLRVMHTMANSSSFFTRIFAHEIEDQIRKRVEPHLHSTPEGLKLGNDAQEIPLSRFEMRGSKPRHSIAMKLLHKRENFASNIFDHVGMRFVTRERFDALLVVRYLRVNNIVMFTHIDPSRCRNSLLDLPRLKAEMAGLHRRSASGEISDEKRLEHLRQHTRTHAYPAAAVHSSNPFSSLSYHSIQFTCRQTITVCNPAYQRMKEEVHRLQAENPSLASSLLPLLSALECERDWHFFFPFEVQIMDQESYDSAHSGLAAHDVYKTNQREAIKRRLLGPLLNTERDPKI